MVYLQTWKISFLPPLLEPLFYLLAFGVGLSSLVGKVTSGGTEIPYVTFIAPALIAINIMNSAFFENTYASFVRMYYQKTFDAILATPLSLTEIIIGEILWGATKSLFGTAIMLAVISAFGLLQYPLALLLLPLSLLGGVAFGAVAMLFTGLVPEYRGFQPAGISLRHPHVPVQRHFFPNREFAGLGAGFRSGLAAHPCRFPHPRTWLGPSGSGDCCGRPATSCCSPWPFSLLPYTACGAG